MAETPNDLQQKANLLRKLSLVSTTEAGSGHPTTCLSAADLMAVLFDAYYTYDLDNPHNPENDRLIFSKGHGAPLFFSLYAVAGAIPITEMKTLRKFGSRIEGHPTPVFPYTEAATGSLGQGLSIAAGIALAGKKDNRSFHTYALLGDGELAEGSVWEAANFASFYKLNKLIAILDINRLGQSQPTMFQHNLEEYIYRFSACGWEVLAIDGHNFSEITKAFDVAIANTSEKPFVIVARTKKGKGISFLEDKDGWHGKTLKKEDLEKALIELGNPSDSLRFVLKKPEKAASLKQKSNTSTVSVEFKIGEEVATREAYGKILADIGSANDLIYSLDGDVKNSTFSEIFKAAHPDRFVECFIAEQNMVGVAIGLSRMGKIPFASTFATFFTRASDQIRMGAISKTNIKLVGSHAGVSIGEDGPSQMGLEEFAMIGALPDTVIFQPCDAVSTAKILPLMVQHNGISYLQTLRPKTPVIYENSEEFTIGGSKILRSSAKDELTLVATGVTVHEALKAYEILKKEGIAVKVLDCYSIKPVDRDTLIECTRTTKENAIITVEDHFVHGGLGDFVAEAVNGTGACVTKLAVDHISRSGTPAELLADAKIDAEAIVARVKETVGS